MQPAKDLGLGSPNQGSEVTIPTQFTHDIKIDDTAKGIRISVHVYANSSTAAVEEAFQMYLIAQAEAIARKIELAPIEVKKQ